MLCENCSDVDLHAVFHRTHTFLGNGLLASKQNPETEWEWKDSLFCCELCRFFTDCLQASVVKRPSDTTSRKAERFQLGSVKYNTTFSFKFEDPDDPFLRLDFSYEEVHSEGRPTYWEEIYLGCTRADDDQEMHFAPRIVPSLVDIPGFLRVLVETCQETHQKNPCCVSADACFPKPIRLIDCETRSVVKAPKNCRYAALSYTWGMGKFQMSDCESRLVYPQTVEDAITVVWGIGLKYIWVDKYCIIQDNEDDRQDQIRQMDLVYRNAQVTIIAAAGDSPDYGLPGVSRPRKSRQVQAKINEILLTSFNCNPWKLVQDSKWNSRGWTFQEAYLSRRRLYFTEEQVIYECRQGWVCESVTWLQRNRRIHFHFGFMYPALPKKQIYKAIEHYAPRQLTYETDVLNAFYGVLNSFQAIQDPVQHLWGVPFFLGEESLKSFIVGLTWRLHPNLDEKNCKRIGFPSWSWTSWKHPMCYYNWDYNFDMYSCAVHYSHDVNVQFELSNGSKIPLMDIERVQASPNMHALLSPFIILEAWIVPIRLEQFSGNDSHHHVLEGEVPVHAIIGDVTYSFETSCQVPFQCEAHKEGASIPYECKGVLMIDHVTNFSRLRIEILLIKQVDDDDHWERLGMVTFEGFKKIPGTDEYQLEQQELRRKKMRAEWQVIRLG